MVAQYTIVNHQVYYEHHYTRRTQLNEVGVDTFIPLVDSAVTGYFAGWHFAAKDQATVWFMNCPVTGADPATFTYYFGGQCHWGVDHQYIYCFYVARKPAYKVIKTADSTRFHFLPNEPPGAYMRQYALDGKHVYYYGRRVLKARPDHFVNLQKDQLQEGFADSDYYRDDRAVFFRGKMVKDASPATFRVFHLPGLGHEVYGFDQRAFFAYGQRLALSTLSMEQQRVITAYVTARPEYRELHWSHLGV